MRTARHNEVVRNSCLCVAGTCLWWSVEDCKPCKRWQQAKREPLLIAWLFYSTLYVVYSTVGFRLARHQLPHTYHCQLTDNSDGNGRNMWSLPSMQWCSQDRWLTMVLVYWFLLHEIVKLKLFSALYVCLLSTHYTVHIWCAFPCTLIACRSCGNFPIIQWCTTIMHFWKKSICWLAISRGTAGVSHNAGELLVIVCTMPGNYCSQSVLLQPLHVFVLLITAAGAASFLIIMATLRRRSGHYIFVLWFLLSFFPRLISAVADWMSTILPQMVWP